MKKDRSSPAFKQLERQFSKHRGLLTLGAVIENPARDPRGVFTNIVDFESFASYYPLLPYHIPLMIDVFATLRARGRKAGYETRLTGRERAVLSVVRSILLAMADKQIGQLASFDAVYDAIGVRIKEFPMTPDKVLEAIGEKGDGEHYRFVNI